MSLHTEKVSNHDSDLSQRFFGCYPSYGFFGLLFAALIFLFGLTLSVAQADVTPTGTYSTRVPIPVPQAPGAPTLSLEYNSATDLGIAGVGWDLSVGWPTTIARDTRFGTPEWRRNSAWLWGSSPLVSTDPVVCAQTGICRYRFAPDNLATAVIDLTASPPTVEITLPSGLILKYTAVVYDGQTYPSAPPVAPPSDGTNVMAFLLQSATDSNGYKTCFLHHHFGDTTRGKVAVMEEITYGPSVRDCSALPVQASRHSVKFRHGDVGLLGYAVPWTMRFGAPVSFSSRLEAITVSALGVEQQEVTLEYEPPTATETRRPRLKEVKETAIPGGNRTQAVERTLYWFAYGNRSAQFGPAEILDLGATGDFPDSLAGSVSRPMRYQSFFRNPSGVFQTGWDQVDDAAPATHATTEQWGFVDLDGDGLTDIHWSRETGTAGNWSTFEAQNTAGPRSAQQLVRRNEGRSGASLTTTPITLDSHSPAIESGYSPEDQAANGFTRWLWAEGRGLTRTGMPVSVSAPESRNIAAICPPAPDQDSRLWPVLPDGTLGGSQGSMAEQIGAASVFNLDRYKTSVSDVVKAIRDAYQPSHSITATLSGWLDMNGDGVPDFVVTPGLIERFTTPTLLCPREPTPPTKPNGDVDGTWYAASFPDRAGSSNTLTLNGMAGPQGPVGLPLDYHVSTGSPEGFGITLPIGSLITTAAEAAATGLSSLTRVPDLIIQTFAPRTSSGFSAYGPSSSATGLIYSLGMVAAGSPSAATAVSSTFKVTYDLTILSTKSRNRSESRAQVMDINADGLPDYLLYDSSTQVGGAPAGGLVAFLNSPGGFTVPQRVNSGLDYTSGHADLSRLAREVANADLHLLWTVGVPPLPSALEICRANPAVDLVTWGLDCGPIIVELQNMVSTVRAAVKAAQPFLASTTDAIPAERYHLGEATALADVIETAWLAHLWSPSAMKASLDLDKDLVEAAAKAVRMLERTARQLDYASRINVPSRGFSELDGAWIGNPAFGLSVQTRGFVDLNGDGLPDYVLTEDRVKTCGPNQWEVFWGSGSSALAATQKAFLATPSCIDVPPPPTDVAAPPPTGRGIQTLPMNVDMVRREPTANAQLVDTKVDSYVSLYDFNHDGRPDLLVAGEENDTWNPNATSRTWTVYLNNGSGFDLDPARRLRVFSPTVIVTGAAPASSFARGLDVPYPAMRTSHVAASPFISRDRSDTHAALMDIDGDGLPEVIRRVTFTPTGSSVQRAGLLVWSRKGTGPQDLLSEKRFPVEGQRVLVEYRPSPLFQWKDGQPDGQPPQGGHRPLAGASGHLVASVTHEPLMGRNEQKTRLGYDYRAPYFDSAQRLPAGFALRSVRLLDPQTGAPIQESVVWLERNPQRPEGVGGITEAREVIAATGAPVRESLTSYAEQVTAPARPGPTRAIFSVPQRMLSIEYPEGLTKAPVFDVGFDGREPFQDRSRGVLPPETTQPTLSPTAASGGAAVFGAMPTPLSYPSPHLSGGSTAASVSVLTIEAWIKPAGSGTIVEQSGAYRLLLTSAGRVRFEAGGASVEAPIASSRWSHVAASLGGGTLRLFVNGVANTVSGGPVAVTVSSPLVVGCVQTTAGLASCLNAELGELRIYPEAWMAPPRVGDKEIELELTSHQRHDFGQVRRLIERNDLATGDDDVVTEFEYAAPTGTSKVVGAVSTKAQRALGADGVTSGNYLGYSELSYDGLPLGQVGSGNPTRTAQFDGASEVQSKPLSSGLKVVTQTAYDPNCPGRPAKVTDPLGFETTTTWDGTCSFMLDTTNGLGHRTSKVYYGVNGVGYSLPGTGGTLGPVAYTGSYGLLAQSFDPNTAALETLVPSARTAYGYDVWGRPAVTRLPLDRRDRPSTRQRHDDARCRDRQGNSLPCADAAAAEIESPPRTKTTTWDDQVERYRLSYSFGDGQVQTETLEAGQPSWTISGTKDFDAQGRVTRVYKVRYLPKSSTATADACPAAGTWCDVTGARDPLRDPATVAAVQTASDARSRVIRTYGPKWPPCPGDPSALDPVNRTPACDAALPATARVHWTRFEYPAPGVTRTIDARGVPTVTRTDFRGLVSSVEEYTQASTTTPYATVRSNYDRLGRNVSTIDHQGNTRTTHYDALGRVSSLEDPDLGTTTFKYDLRSQLLEQVIATGDKTVNTYDPIGRVTQTDYLRRGAGPLNPVCCDIPHGWPGPKVSPPDSWTIVPGINRYNHFGPVPPRPGLQFEPQPLPLTLGGLDNGVAELKLPFDFTLTPNAVWAISGPGRETVKPVPGRNLFKAGTTLFVSTNGKIRFDPGGAEDVAPGTGESLPTNKPEIGVYPFFTDLDLHPGGLSYGISGEAPDRRLDIVWDGTLASRPEDRVQVRATLFENDSEVRFAYERVPQDWKATIGAQNHSLETPLVFVVHARGKDAEPFLPVRGTEISSHQPRGNTVLRLNSLVASRAELIVDARKAKEGELRLHHRWLSRCALEPAGRCKVDRMRVAYRDSGDPESTVTLLGPEQLTANRYLDAHGNTEFKDEINIRLPAAIAGRVFTLLFEYDPSQPTRLLAGWEIGPVDVGITTYTIEERVLRQYDSAEPDYYLRKNAVQKLEEAKPLLDFTFDVPGRISDRSPTGADVPSGISLDAVAGVAGRAGRLGPGTEIELRKPTGPLGNFTAEAWVRPESYPSSSQLLLSSDGIFALSLLPDGRLECTMTGGSSAITSTSPLPRDAWTHVALIREGATFRCAINGVEQGSPQQIGSGSFTFLRTRLGDSSGTASAALDEVRLLPEARSSAEVLGDALRPLHPGPPRGNLVDIGFGDPSRPADDASRAGNHGTLTGGAIVPGIQGMSFDTRGTGEVRVPHSATLRIPEAVTAEAWLKTRNHAIGPALLLGKWLGGGTPGWRLGLEPKTGRVRWETVTRYTPPVGPTQLLHAVFVTYEQVNDNAWHHVAATYDGKRLRVFIDGVPAHRTCSPLEPGTAPDPCTDPPPPDKCVTEVVPLGENRKDHGDAVCTHGTIENGVDIVAATDAQGSLRGFLDELRVSNYAKREFEIAASSRLASAYAQVLGAEVELRNQLPVGPELDKQVADEHRAFDARGRFVSALKRVRGQSATTPFLTRAASDGLDRLGSQEYPTGEVLVGAYDLSTVQTSLIGYGPSVVAQISGKQPYLTTATTTVTGRVASLIHGNRVLSSYTYDDGPSQGSAFGNELLRSQSISAAAGTLSNRQYSWNDVGNLDSVDDSAEGYQATYTHDDLQRIRSASFNLGAQAFSYGFDYDSLGNLTLKEGATQQYGRSLSPVDCGTGTTALPHAVTRRTVTGVVDSFCYDEAGRLVRATDTARSTFRNLYYFARSKLQKLSYPNGDYTFNYDGDGNRIAKTEGNGSTIEPFGYYREIPGGAESLYFANGRRIARRTIGGSSDVFWYHSDHLDGTNLITTMAGSEDVNARSHYRPFGEFLPGASPQNDHAGGRQFTGKELDDTGLYDYGARYYDPVLARFIDPDAVVPGITLQAHNRYAYAFNSPTEFIDPTGHSPQRVVEFSEEESKAAGGVIRGGITIWGEEIVVKPPAWWSEQQQKGGRGAELAVGVAERTRGLQELAAAHLAISMAPLAIFGAGEVIGGVALWEAVNAASIRLYLSAPRVFDVLIAGVYAIGGLPRAGSAGKSAVIVKPGKWDYFFGRVTSNPHNQARSLQNLKDLKTLGFDEASGGGEALMKLFEQGKSLPEAARLVTEHGVTITRTVRVGGIGAIDVKYFYPGGDMNAVPEISTIIPKIFK